MSILAKTFISFQQYVFNKNLENKVCDEFFIQTKFYKRYDCFLVWSSDNESLGYLLNKFNSVHANIKFTMELETNKTLPFLDVLIDYNQNTTFSVYRKDTHSGIYFNDNSNHPISTKIGIIQSPNHRNS